MKYWHMASSTRPRLSKMGSDFGSAPGRHLLLNQVTYFGSHSMVASSVDAERAFSVGRHELSHLQHNTSTQTFKAQMAVGSWVKTPLYPGFTEATKIVQTQIKKDKLTPVTVISKEASIDGSDEDEDEEARFWRD